MLHSSLTISKRLSIGFGLVTALMALITAVSVYSMRDTNHRVSVVIEELTPTVKLVEQLKQLVNQSGTSLRNVAILADPAELKQEYVRLNDAYQNYDKVAHELQQRSGISLLFADEAAALTRLEAAHKEAMSTFSGAVEKGGATGTPEDIAVLLRMQLRMDLAGATRSQDRWLAEIDSLQKQVTQVIDAHQEAIVARSRQGMALLLAVAAAAVAIAVAASITIMRSITRPLRSAIAVADLMAEGDLSHPVVVERSDEMGQLLSRLEAVRARWFAIVSNLRITADSISHASSEIATGNLDLSHRTEQAASNLQHAASSMAQLTGTVRHSADSSRQANQMASSAAEVAVRGGTVVSQVVTTMDEINTSSRKIADIIGVIDGIAFQTNILALNAAVEAARAGEQGRGFAVVASEVRNLAVRSAEAAKEIKGLIGASVDKVEAGSRLVANAGVTMAEIVGSVQRVSDMIGEITAATSEQNAGIGQVNTTVSQLDQMTQQNAALVEESAAAAESLKQQALALAEVVGNFRLESARG